MEASMTTVLYARCSTAEQTLDHQKDQAEKAGFKIDCVIADHGVSGVSTTLAERPKGKRLFDKLRSGDTLVVRWVDRLGRNYEDVTNTIRHFIGMGVTVKTVINGMVFDGQPKSAMDKAVRDALIGFMAASAEAQAESTREAQKAGIEHAKKDRKKYLGRKPAYTREQLSQIMELKAGGMGINQIAREIELASSTVQRIAADTEAASEKLARWENKPT